MPCGTLASAVTAGAQYRDQGVVQYCAADLSATELKEVADFFAGTLIAECDLLDRAHLQP